MRRLLKIAILSIVLTIDGEPVFIRKSAFSDLASPKELFLAKDKEKLFLTIKGGDAAESYMAILRFSQTGLEYRKVASREFPDDAWEESFYAYPVFDWTMSQRQISDVPEDKANHQHHSLAHLILFLQGKIHTKRLKA